MRRLKIYVETSVWGMLVNDEPVIWRETTEDFFTRAGNFNLFISPVVLEEINNASRKIKQTILKKVIDVNPDVLQKDLEIDYLIEEYISRDAFSKNQHYDASHVAYASIYDMDILVSFNYKHIVRYRVKNLVKSVNIVQGYTTPEIISSLQLF